MAPIVTAYRLPKQGYSIEECDDAFAYELNALRFAIADGATESAFSDRWAQSLVKAYVNEPPFGMPPEEDAMMLWMLPLQHEWRQGIDWANLPWYCQEKAENGAFATFLALEFAAHGTVWEKIVSRTLQGEELKWNAFAVGDSNLFQVRGEEMLVTFPVGRSDEFSSRPILLASNENHNYSAVRDIKSASGGVKAGDLFFLATDALAKWFLERHEAGEKPWQRLLAVKDEAEFAALSERLRREEGVRNDDMTLVVIRWEG